eukprot:341395-Prorocentrum_minimum.AAC.1
MLGGFAACSVIVVVSPVAPMRAALIGIVNNAMSQSCWRIGANLAGARGAAASSAGAQGGASPLQP